MVRPHPAVWRTIHGVLVLYVLLLVFLVFQDIHDARAFLTVSSASVWSMNGFSVQFTVC